MEEKDVDDMNIIASDMVKDIQPNTSDDITIMLVLI